MQVEIVDEEIAGRIICQRVAEIVHQQPTARGVRGAGIVPQEGEACAGERLLYAFPEYRMLSEYTLTRMMRNVSALARSARYQFTAVVFP